MFQLPPVWHYLKWFVSVSDGFNLMGSIDGIDYAA
jgi:hypothetical protein